ncbi:MAG TPA: RDD family protein [Bryobacteraceae bacterium]|nr:RDD family protein [Bryobacteraceae bacterium]
MASVSQNYPATRSNFALAFAEPAVVVEEPVPAPRPRTPVPQKLNFEDPSASNVIPFESFAAHRVQPLAPAVKPAEAAPPAEPPRDINPSTAPARSAPLKAQARRRTAPSQTSGLQTDLDFLTPPPQGPRTLKTQVEAVIYCDAEVAAPRHRAVAAAIDGGMIFTGFGLFLFAFHFMGGMFRLNRQTLPFFLGVLGTLAMFYGMLWIWAGRETVGMRLTGLRLIDFDGFPADRRNRLLRTLAACLSFCAGGIGLLWALVDEEKLTWHDHMSKTFPTLQESNRSFLRSR